jgi:hypothetical protein
MAQFNYCPVGMSIAKTFNLPTSPKAQRGSELHEKQYLLGNKKREYDQFKAGTSESESTHDPFEEPKNKNTAEFFRNIEHSKLVFSGHNNDNSENNYMVNDERGYAGQPDYIFQDSSGKHFVVEEKFTNSNTFWSNHKVQLASYIYLIKEYPIKYGYLLYWYTEYDNSIPYLKCKVQKIDRNDSVKNFVKKTYYAIKDFREKGKMPFEVKKMNPNKCANCVHLLACGHKNQRHNEITFPYNDKYLKLYPAKYPEELKKKKG